MVDFVEGLAVGQRGQIVWRLVPNIVGGRVEIKFHFRRPTPSTVYTQVADVLERKELLVRCDVGPGELAWEDGVQFTRAQLEGDVSLVNVYARANGCHELSRTSESRICTAARRV